jgi:hypothetical protein
MPIMVIDEKLAFVRLEISLAEIPCLLVRHAERYPGSEKLEMRGFGLVAGDFEEEDAAAFVKQVCEWGGGDRFVGRVLEKNTKKQIADGLRDGFQQAQRGEVGAGVRRICQLKHLGQSFASKQLRFLAPTHAVILDEVIRSNLGYQETVPGYDEFLADCQAILKRAKTQGLLRPTTKPLRIADIEAAVFAKIQGF